MAYTKENEDIPSMYPSHDYTKGPQWGMSIDLNVCSGVMLVLCLSK